MILVDLESVESLYHQFGLQVFYKNIQIFKWNLTADDWTLISVFTSSFCSFFLSIKYSSTTEVTLLNLPTVQHWIDIWQLCSWHYIQFTRKFQSLSYDLKPLSADQSQHFLQYFEFKEIENVNPNFFRNNWHLQSIFHFQTIFSFFHTFRGVFTYANYFFHFQKFIVLITHCRIKIVWTFEVFKSEFLLFFFYNNFIWYSFFVKFKVCFGGAIRIEFFTV